MHSPFPNAHYAKPMKKELLSVGTSKILYFKKGKGFDSPLVLKVFIPYGVILTTIYKHNTDR